MGSRANIRTPQGVVVWKRRQFWYWWDAADCWTNWDRLVNEGSMLTVQRIELHRLSRLERMG